MVGTLDEAEQKEKAAARQRTPRRREAGHERSIAARHHHAERRAASTKPACDPSAPRTRAAVSACCPATPICLTVLPPSVVRWRSADGDRALLRDPRRRADRQGRRERVGRLPRGRSRSRSATSSTPRCARARGREGRGGARARRGDAAARQRRASARPLSASVRRLGIVRRRKGRAMSEAGPERERDPMAEASQLAAERARDAAQERRALARTRGWGRSAFSAGPSSCRRSRGCSSDAGWTRCTTWASSSPRLSS